MKHTIIYSMHGLIVFWFEFELLNAFFDAKMFFWIYSRCKHFCIFFCFLIASLTENYHWLIIDAKLTFLLNSLLMQKNLIKFSIFNKILWCKHSIHKLILHSFILTWSSSLKSRNQPRVPHDPIITSFTTLRANLLADFSLKHSCLRLEVQLIKKQFLCTHILVPIV